MSFRRSKLRARRKIRGGRRSKRLIWFGVLLAGIAVLLDIQMRPTITAMASYQTNITVTDIINRAAHEIFQDDSYEYSDFVTLTLNDEGNISSIETNTNKVNSVQTELTQKIVEALIQPGRGSIGIPLGTLLGFHLLSGRGPTVEIKIIPVGNVKAVTKSVFSSAGINQTLHQITVEVDATAMAIIPGYSTEVSVHTEYILAETMVVGTVPDSYAQIITQGESAIPYLSDQLQNQ